MPDERSGELKAEVIGKMALADFPPDLDWGLEPDDRIALKAQPIIALGRFIGTLLTFQNLRLIWNTVLHVEHGKIGKIMSADVEFVGGGVDVVCNTGLALPRRRTLRHALAAARYRC